MKPINWPNVFEKVLTALITAGITALVASMVLVWRLEHRVDMIEATVANVDANVVAIGTMLADHMEEFEIQKMVRDKTKTYDVEVIF